MHSYAPHLDDDFSMDPICKCVASALLRNTFNDDNGNGLCMYTFRDIRKACFCSRKDSRAKQRWVILKRKLDSRSCLLFMTWPVQFKQNSLFRNFTEVPKGSQESSSPHITGVVDKDRYLFPMPPWLLLDDSRDTFIGSHHIQEVFQIKQSAAESKQNFSKARPCMKGQRIDEWLEGPIRNRLFLLRNRRGHPVREQTRVWRVFPCVRIPSSKRDGVRRQRSIW